MAINRNTTFRADDMSFMDNDSGFSQQDQNKVKKAVKLIFSPLKGLAKGLVDQAVDNNLKDLDDAKVQEKALALENVIRNIEGKSIKKVIVVKNKIVNIVAI